MDMNRRQALSLALGAGAAVSLGIRPSLAADDIVIGGSIPLSGVFAFAGIGIHAGIQDYVKIVNDGGGIAGRKVTYLAEDTAYKADQSVAVFNKLTSQANINLYYADSTAFSKTINAELDRKKSILMAGASFASELNDPKKYPFQFISGPDYTQMFDILLQYVAKTKPGAKIAFVHSDTEFGRDPIAAGQEKVKALGLKMTETIVTPPSAVDVSTEILKLRRANPDYTIFHGYVLAPLPEFMSQAKQMGLATKFMGTFWSMDNSLWAKVGDPADGFMGVMPYRYYYDTDGKSPMLDKIRQMRPEYQSTAYMQGFLTAMLFLESAKRTLEAKQELNGTNLKAALNSLKDFDTGGLIGVPISIPGNSIPVGRVYRFDAAKKLMVADSDWIKVGG